MRRVRPVGSRANGVAVRSLALRSLALKSLALTSLALTSLVFAIPFARFAYADTILTFDLSSGSNLAGSATGSPTAFCVAGTTCPGASPAYTLGANVPLNGTVSIDTTNSTMTFDLSLTQNASFGGVTLNQGSSFVAQATDPISISISSSTSKKGVVTDTILPGTGTATALGTLLLSSGFTQTAGQPLVSGLDCLITVGAGGSCGLTLGADVTGTNALQITNGSNTYDGVMSIGANLVAVPLPPGLWLMAGGMSGMLLTFRRRTCRRHTIGR